ncbi:hypothetical protein GGF32_002416 [Allomyces javanicus]|nr:hypothetical protein GGF32_002416 [Allomyces javanicus]
MAIDETKAPSSGIGPMTKQVMLAMGYTAADAPEFTSRKDVASIDSRALRAPSASLMDDTKAVADNYSGATRGESTLVMSMSCTIAAFVVAVVVGWF